MSDTLRIDVGQLHDVAAFGTLAVGVVGLTAGIESNVIAPVVMLGALVVGFIDIYWLFGGDGGVYG